MNVNWPQKPNFVKIQYQHIVAVVVDTRIIWTRYGKCQRHKNIALGAISRFPLDGEPKTTNTLI